MTSRGKEGSLRAARGRPSQPRGSNRPVDTNPKDWVWQTTVSYDHPDPAVRAALVWTLGGWRKPVGGHLAVLGRVLPEEAGAVRKSVRVVPLPSRDDDAVDVRRYVSTLLVAQSDKPWPSRRTTGRALDQAENWLSPLQAGTEGPRLADRRMGDLTTLERLLVTLSAAAVQSPELIVVAEPDRDLDPGSLSWFAGVCAELVHDTGTTVLLVGSTVTALAAAPASPVPGSETVAPDLASVVPGPADDPDPTAADPAPAATVDPTAEAPVPADEADDGTPDRPDPARRDRDPDRPAPGDPETAGPDDDTETRKQTHELTGQ